MVILEGTNYCSLIQSHFFPKDQQNTVFIGKFKGMDRKNVSVLVFQNEIMINIVEHV